MAEDAIAGLGADLKRIAAALERLAGAAPPFPDWHAAEAFVWQGAAETFQPVARVATPALDLLLGIELVKGKLLENTRRFAHGFPANNALLWGARGMGKSSLIKAAHAEVNRLRAGGERLALIEIHREEIETLPCLMNHVRAGPRRAILFCDDLSFDAGDANYKALKAALEGGLEGRPDNALFYATSNRRHLLPREIMENERSSAINPGDAVEEKISLSDRFGLWLGFHGCGQDDYLAMIAAYLAHHGIEAPRADWEPLAIEWSATRGARSGRVAWQFVQDYAGSRGHRLSA